MIRSLKSQPADDSLSRIRLSDLGRLELGVMEILWARGESSVRDVAQKLACPLAYTTVMTTLDRLYKKISSIVENPSARFFILPDFRAKNGSASAPETSSLGSSPARAPRAICSSPVSLTLWDSMTKPCAQRRFTPSIASLSIDPLIPVDGSLSSPNYSPW